MGPSDIRRILQESAGAPDVQQWFREHPMERESLTVFLRQSVLPQGGVRPHEPANRQFRNDEGRLWVGPLLPPPGTCTFSATTPPFHAPDGEPLAQLAHIPGSLSDFIGVAFPPFGPPPRKLVDLPPLEERIAYRVVGIVQYRGEEGEVVIETSRPSAAALRKELILGNPAGTLPDGTPLATAWGNMLRWRKGDMIIDLHDSTNSMTRERLQDFAAEVVLS